MSKAIQKLRKLEVLNNREWYASARYVQECRNALNTADLSDVPQLAASLQMAVIKCDRDFAAWLTVCETLDEIEAMTHRRNGEH
jgi:hypothetical protein